MNGVRVVSNVLDRRRNLSDVVATGFLARFHSTTATNRRYLIFGANTDVGKTVLTAGLVRACCDDAVAGATVAAAAKHNGMPKVVHYIKPLQCGLPGDEDFLKRHTTHQQHQILHTKTLFTWKTPASPHVASVRENQPCSDAQISEALQSALMDIEGDGGSRGSTTTNTTTWIETAGGVLSPSSASPLNRGTHHAKTEASNTEDWGWTTQADIYQGMGQCCPTVLVGDGRLGGISATLSSLESLLHRNYHVSSILLLGGTDYSHDNVSALREYVSTATMRARHQENQLFPNPGASIVSFPRLPPQPKPLHYWYESEEVKAAFQSVVEVLEKEWERLQP